MTCFASDRQTTCGNIAGQLVDFHELVFAAISGTAECRYMRQLFLNHSFSSTPTACGWFQQGTIAIMAAGPPVAQGLDDFGGEAFRWRAADSCDLGGGVLHWGR